MKNLNVRAETLKLLKENNIGSKLLHIGIGDNILDLTLRAKVTKAKNKKWTV